MLAGEDLPISHLQGQLGGMSKPVEWPLRRGRKKETGKSRSFCASAVLSSAFATFESAAASSALVRSVIGSSLIAVAQPQMNFIFSLDLRSFTVVMTRRLQAFRLEPASSILLHNPWSESGLGGDRGHVLYVLEGEIESELKDGRRFILSAGALR
jgi:hypothetical protein